jgi:anti-sigma B factor antagonist
MTITKDKKGDIVTLFVEGSINTQTSEEFEKAISDVFKDTHNLVVDLSKTDYISSSGLRVFLWAQNEVEDKGSMVVRHVAPQVKEVFDMTGFSSLLTLE